MHKITFYDPKEEKINVISHAIGLVLSILGTVMLVAKAWSLAGFSKIFPFVVYGISLIVLYTASTIYHKERNPEKRKRYKIFDHAAIYFLIVGTYTPFTLVVLKGTLGWTIFGIAWGLAMIGIILKLFFTGKYIKISTAAYIMMGWLIVFAIRPLIEYFTKEGLIWLFTGGLFYTVGAILYGFKKIKYTHAIFHVFVLIASICHFIAVYYYVLPMVV